MLELRAKHNGTTVEQEFEALTTKYHKLRDIANDLRVVDGTIIYWIQKLQYTYDHSQKRYVKKSNTPEPEQESVA